MSHPIKIGIIGDFNSSYPSHIATDESLGHSGKAIGVTVEPTWLLSHSLDVEVSEQILPQFDALWCAPGSPYKSMNGALKAIRFAREMGWPFIGT